MMKTTVKILSCWILCLDSLSQAQATVAHAFSQSGIAPKDYEVMPVRDQTSEADNANDGKKRQNRARGKGTKFVFLIHDWSHRVAPATNNFIVFFNITWIILCRVVVAGLCMSLLDSVCLWMKALVYFPHFNYYVKQKNMQEFS